MKTISADQFREYTITNPFWAAAQKEPVAIKGFCDMRDSPIATLSPMLTFLGKKGRVDCATFQGCTLLTVAGTFHGHVCFENCIIEEVAPTLNIHTRKEAQLERDAIEKGAASFRFARIRLLGGTFHGKVIAEVSEIERIGQLAVTKKDTRGLAADFSQVRGLTVAKGRFAGFADFSESTVERIDPCPETGLVITHPDSMGNAADFTGCNNLKIATGTFPGMVDFFNSGIEKISNLEVTGRSTDGHSASFNECKRLKEADGSYDGHVDFEHTALERIAKTLKIRNPMENTGWYCSMARTPLQEKSPLQTGLATFGLGPGEAEKLESIIQNRTTKQLPFYTIHIMEEIARNRKARSAIKGKETVFEI